MESATPVQDRQWSTTQAHIRMAGGHRFRHPVETRHLWTTCVTDYPASVCTCGYYHLEWPPLAQQPSAPEG